eukprot:gene6110-23088_t
MRTPSPAFADDVQEGLFVTDPALGAAPRQGRPRAPMGNGRRACRLSPHLRCPPRWPAGFCSRRRTARRAGRRAQEAATGGCDRRLRHSAVTRPALSGTRWRLVG